MEWIEGQGRPYLRSLRSALVREQSNVDEAKIVAVNDLVDAVVVYLRTRHIILLRTPSLPGRNGKRPSCKRVADDYYAYAALCNRFFYLSAVHNSVAMVR
eukprot:scaffold319180_cov19-Prasinocladus_malaysianus.AAC.2